MKLNKLFLLSFCFIIESYAFTLNEGFKYALESDMTSKVNENNIENIKIDKEIANSLLNPKLDLDTSVQLSKTSDNRYLPNNNESHAKTDQYKLTLTQPIFDGFESKNEKRLQKYRFNSAIYHLKESQNDLALSYTQNYINTLKQKDILSLEKESVRISQDIVKKVHKKLEVGYGTKLEYDEAKAELSKNKISYKSQKIAFKEAIENLKFYVQTDFDTNELIRPVFSYNLPKTLNETLKKAKKTSPSVKVSQINLEVAKAEERKNNKKFYPNLDLVGSYQINDALYRNKEESNNYKLGLQLNYNLYNGGRDELEVKKSLQNIKEKQFLIKKVEQKIENTLRLAWNNYKLNSEKNKTLEEYVIVKKDVLEATKKEFDLGLKTLNSLLNTHTKYIEAKQDYIANAYDLLFSKYRILSAMGVLSEVLQNNVSSLAYDETSEFSLNISEETNYSYKKPKKLKKKVLFYDDTKVNSNSMVDLDDILLLGSKKETKKQKKPLITKIKNEDISDFKSLFLNSSGNKYTINLALVNSEQKAYKFLKRHKLKQKAFNFSFGYTNPLQKIMLGVYDSKDDAKKAIKKLSKALKLNRPTVEKVKIKQKLFKKYHHDEYLRITQNRQRKEKYSKLVVSTSSKEYNRDFKQKFLEASSNKYTINLAYTKSPRRAEKIIERYNLNKNSFFFSFGNDRIFQKIVLGVYNTKEEAQEALSSLPKSLLRNRPIIENITRKQNLYYKYNKQYKNSERI